MTSKTALYIWQKYISIFCLLGNIVEPAHMKIMGFSRTNIILTTFDFDLNVC